MHPLQLRPLSFGEILDGAFQIYRARFATLFLTALAPYLPLVVAGAIIGAAAGAGSDAGMVAGGLAVMISLPLTLVGFLAAWGGVTHLVSEAYLGRPVAAGEGIRHGLRRALPLLGATFLAGVLAMFGLLLFVVPGIIILGMLFAIYPAVVIEGRGPVEALGRSRALARGDLPRILGILFVAYLIAALPGWAISVVTTVSSMSSGAAGPSMVMTLVSALLQVVVSALTLPFSTAVAVLLYYDRRVRTEALDVQLAAERLGAAPATV